MQIYHYLVISDSEKFVRKAKNMKPQFMPQGDLLPTQPCKIHHNKLTPTGISQNSYSLNYHETAEILCCVGGEGNVLIKEQFYRMNPGDILIIHPGLLHQVLPPENSFEIYCLILNNVFCRNLGIDLEALKFECHFHDADFAGSIAGLGALYCKYSAADKISAVRLINAFSALLLYLMEYHLISDDYKETISSAENTVKAAIKFIQNNFHEKITLDKISDELYVNKFYLCKIFRHYTGMSVITYVNELRLTKARLMLHEGHRVAEVSEKCGFTNQSYFTRIYKKRYGILPSEG